MSKLLHETPAYRAAYGSAISTQDLLEVLTSKPVARALVDAFPCLPDLASASADDLAQLPGVGLVNAAKVRAALALSLRLKIMDAPKIIRCQADAASVFLPYMENAEQELFFALPVNTRNMIICEPFMVYQGNVGGLSINVGEVFRESVKRKAVSLFVAHNHPSGDPSPSPEDIAVSRALSAAGKLLGVKLLDHIIIGRGGRWVSIRERFPDVFQD